MKRKMMRIILTGVCAVCLTACGKSEKDAASDDYQEQFGMNEENADEPADALDGNGGVQTEAAPETEAEPEAEAELPLGYVEPTASSFEYHYDAALGGVVITRYTGEAEAIRIPAEIDGDPVVEICLGISPDLYNDSGHITHVELPDSITSIGENAFCEFHNLTEIIIPDSVTSIGKNAFYDCWCLTEITIPDSVTSIGECAFGGCDGLTNITIPGSVTSIGVGAFLDCESLTEITILDGVTSIDEWAFNDCQSLTEITIPDSVTYIGFRAFGNCSSLRNLTIPDNAEIAESAFAFSTQLTVSYQGEEYRFFGYDPNGWWKIE